MKTLKDLDLAGKTVLVRVDYNVPVQDGEVGDLLRIEASLPTLKYLHEQNCRQVLISHLGRPEGRVDPKYSLKPVAAKLAELMDHEIRFASDCVGDEVAAQVKALPEHGMILLENLRFHPEEEANDPGFAAQLASLGEVFVQDGFAVVHRAHASTSGVAKLLPSGAGLLLEKEVKTITQALSDPKRPLVAIIGGAKVSDKIEVIETFIKRVDHLIIGGAMANTFLGAQGIKMGKSLHESDQFATARRLIDLAQQQKVDLVLPRDVIVAKEISAAASARDANLDTVAEDDYILDLGPKSVLAMANTLAEAQTVIWNGPLGYTEYPQFRNASQKVAELIIDSGAHSIIGGGDTAAFVDAAGLHNKFSWVSTGGGASLELMAGKSLPGVEALG
jgi:3-phosphoglycerate kinase